MSSAFVVPCIRNVLVKCMADYLSFYLGDCEVGLSGVGLFLTCSGWSVLFPLEYLVYVSSECFVFGITDLLAGYIVVFLLYCLKVG